MWFYGRQTVHEILNSGHGARKLLVAEDASGDIVEKILKLAVSRKISVQKVQKRSIDSLTKGNHQGVALQAEPIGPLDFKAFVQQAEQDRSSFICLLDEVQDPQNVGAILRSALAFGCSGVVIPKWRSAGMSETVMRASSGAAAHLPMVEIANLGVAIERLKEKNYTVYGTDVEAGEPLHKVKFEFSLAIVMGNEQRGIKPILRKSCDRLVTIPQTSGIASLNVSSAAAILFYEIFRQSHG